MPILADYSITAQTRHEENGGDDSNEISGNGTVGVNLGPWRMRADWQTNYQHTRSNDDDDEFGGDDTQKKWEWSRYYAWRALPSLKAKLALGEDYLNSDIFDRWRARVSATYINRRSSASGKSSTGGSSASSIIDSRAAAGKPSLPSCKPTMMT